MSEDKGKCHHCEVRFTYRTTGFVVNGAKQEFCSPQCSEAHHRRMERIRKGQATWDDL